MRWTDRFPPRPAHRAVAIGVAIVVFAHGVLLSAYFVLGDIQDGHRGSLVPRLIDQFTGAVWALPCLAFAAWAAARWPLEGGTWRRNLLPTLVAFVVFSSVHTIAMIESRVLLYPLAGHGPYAGNALGLAIVHEMPNDVYYYGVWLAAMGLWRFWWRTMEREKRDTELERAMAEAQLSTLRLQLQPHFLFNALNTVSSVMYEDPARADAMLSELAELLRASLRSAQAREVPLGEELETMGRYVRLQQERFGDRLAVTIDADADTRHLLVPSFVLQPLVENAVRHGGAETRGQGRITVSARRSNGELALVVHDDGDAGATGVPGTGLGLRTTAERLRLLHGDAARCAAGPEADGWVVRLTFPAREAGA